MSEAGSNNPDADAKLVKYINKNNKLMVDFGFAGAHNELGESP
jgi:hypothetical protein